MAERAYHHGNLKEAMVKAALQLIAEKGPAGFTMAEATKMAGVSAAAPYRHFKNREDLLAEIALQGFEIFADLLAYAADKYPLPTRRIEALGRAYLAFARNQPAHYMAMFESGICINDRPPLAQAANGAMNIMQKAAEDLIANMPEDRRPPAMMITHHIWALGHGIVELFARGEAGARSPFSDEELLESAIGVYLRGLGLLPKDQ